jgi:hypothetical protein
LGVPQLMLHTLEQVQDFRKNFLDLKLVLVFWKLQAHYHGTRLQVPTLYIMH